MRLKQLTTIAAVVGVLACSSVATAQGVQVDTTIEQPSAAPPEGWKTCPRCQNHKDRAEAWKKNNVDGHPFNPRDLTGIWGWGGANDGNQGAIGDRENPIPPLTPWGQQWLAARGGEKPDSRNVPEIRGCDPLGYPRLFGYNYGMQFIVQPDSVLQFFEFGHTWRTIWTDGRKLPANPPELRFLGWNVGRWEGDTFVVESTGFDEKAWMSEDMKLVEKYRRTSYGTMEIELTIIDPKAYTKPFVHKGRTVLVTDTELWEYFCVPSNEKGFDAALPDLQESTVGGQR